MKKLINFNSKLNRLIINSVENTSISLLNDILWKINKKLVVFKHENGLMLSDTKGKFHKLDKKLTIKL